VAFSRLKDGFDSRTRYQFAVEGRETRVEGQKQVGRKLKMKFRFEKLDVWHEARTINHSIYQVTKAFPRHEVFAMTSQLRRAVVSISSNIAEGAGRNSDKDFAHFLEQAYGSLMEVASLLYVAADENYVLQSELEPLLMELEKLAKRIAALNRSLKVKTSKTPFARQNENSLVTRP
jgi:four helix bundle protein